MTTTTKGKKKKKGKKGKKSNSQSNDVAATPPPEPVEAAAEPPVVPVAETAEVDAGKGEGSSGQEPSKSAPAEEGETALGRIMKIGRYVDAFVSLPPRPSAKLDVWDLISQYFLLSFSLIFDPDKRKIPFREAKD